ncbi:hypothetical protein [Aquisphaera insulae]|uniref:hypothetical protein n=1 Tax=Aquisphaera insulae TaxID=2712864 RepID=UPI0013EA5141|nr:hypothetical protein [Aquisphaera insulae]
MREGLCVLLMAAGTLTAAAGTPARDDGEADAKVPAAEKPKASTFHDDFESPQVAWEREHTDTTINLISQERSDRAAHDGNRSERFQFEAGAGGQFFVSYAVPKVPVSDSLSVVVYTRANRIGVQAYVRVVLPTDIDPDTKAPSFLLIPGTIYDRVDRWQRLEILGLTASVERQARVLRASSRRPVSLENAYIDKVVVNLLGGSGASEVFLDDLSVSPVSPEVLANWTKPEARPNSPRPSTAPPRAGGGDEDRKKLVRLDRNLLRRLGEDGKLRDWFPTAVDAPGADVSQLRLYGADILVDDRRTDRERIKTAIDKGFLLMPRLESDDPDAAVKEVEEYAFKDAVALWQIGGRLGARRDPKAREAELGRIRQVVSSMRQLPPGIPGITTGEVVGDLPYYSRAPGNLDTIGIRPLLWASSQNLGEGLEFLRQRRRLAAKANPRGFFWAWLPVAAPSIVGENIWGNDVPPAWGRPRVTPEQLRLMTYMALSAGYHGLGFLGDAELTRLDGPGRVLLIELAFLNMEIDICESTLAQGADPISNYDVFDPDPPDLPPPGTPLGTRVRPRKEFAPRAGLVASAIKDSRRGTLVLLADYAANAEFQPPQMAARNLIFRPMLREGAQAYQISPGGVKHLPRDRSPGGTQLTLDEFDTTALILCTTDLGLRERVEAAVARVRPVAVSLAIEQAERLLQEATDINGRLNADGHPLIGPDLIKRWKELGVTTRPTDERDLLAKAEASIRSAREAQERLDFALAWDEARRASRPLRTLMHGHWSNAQAAFLQATLNNPPKRTDDSKVPIPHLVRPVCCAPAIGFNTLPELYLWIDWIAGKPGYHFGANRVPSGSFDDPKGMAEDGWVNMDYQLEGLVARMATVPKEEGKPDRMIRMSVEPAQKEDLDRNVPFLDFPIAAVRSPAVRVEAQNLIRISVLVKRPIASAPGMGGIIVRDSIGGEQLQYRTSEPIPSWSRVLIYRKAPADVDLTVTLGLAGYGEAFFDDLRVELVEEDARGSRGGEIAESGPARRQAQPRTPETSLPATATGPTVPRLRRE